MENQLLKSISIKYGVILAGIYLINGLITFFIISPDNSNNLLESPLLMGAGLMGILTSLAYGVCIAMAHYEYNNKNNGFISFTDALIIGLIIIGISSFVYGFVGYLNKDSFSSGESEDVGFLFSISSYLGIVVLGILSSIFSLLFIIMLESMWKVYRKARKEGWAPFVPIYRTIALLEIIKKPFWWFFMLFIPGVNLIFRIWMVNLLSKKFGKDEGFTVGLIFLPFIFYPLLGMSDAKYIDNEESRQFYKPDVLDA